ncbi:MarR family winged helix-turn-helix transcriptional regulator [Arenimonas donghaensis]|uniref:HTH marR-type domain-containing protein n=1 Tax=Arenimonas donghaensis DSM 18148 = HO3-R19 TaxID=1121014 RepID=A0A087MM04_9GAMM|nr:MarR family transcriptional regulator [Arenimonas donghaensis]KFL37907.1 hypothetical protein N788_01680 [Arenimonas donghaensis DSM 18148 = HO3-R19]
MSRDFAEHLVTQWSEARPELDAAPMALVVRIMRVNALLSERLAKVLAAHGLSVWEFDMLATLRRNGPDGLSPKQLQREMLLSSGAMTHRIDRLEEAGLVERRPEPTDRRGTIVRLTPAGAKRVDPIIRDRFEDARQVLELLDPAQARAVSDGLRKLAIELQDGSW